MRYDKTAIVVWIVLVIGGSLSLADYGTTPGARGVSPERWPEVDGIQLLTDSTTSVVSLHPRCSCSTASVAELERLALQADHALQGYALFFVPAGEDADWAQGALWDRVSAIPGVVPIVDSGGASAERLGALTSGHLVIYGDDRRLRYTGGLTASRGHEGRSSGSARALSALRGAGRARQAAVFGCPIQDHPTRDREQL